MDLDPDRIIRSPWAAGAVGAMVALRGAPGETWAGRLFHVACGLAIAGYLTDAVAQYFGLESSAMQSGAAFLLGMFGMNLAAAVTTAIRETRLSDVLPWRRGKD